MSIYIYIYICLLRVNKELSDGVRTLAETRRNNNVVVCTGLRVGDGV